MARPTTMEELADRLEIDDLCNLYVTALDDNKFELLDEVFTNDAHVCRTPTPAWRETTQRSVSGWRSSASISGCGSIW